LNPDQQIELETWIASLTQEGKTAAKLTAVYPDCEQLLAGNPQGPQLLWRGRDMNESVMTLSMDRPTLVAALLFPIATSGVLVNESLEEGFCREVVKLIHRVEEMAAIG
ncbi:HD domain-containing protein, partial [Vibrio cholerae]|uniref:HD domain-containing protein n=1 Tax=Vibrio cholerae TaxID=666 RepID=UPI0039C925D6